MISSIFRRMGTNGCTSSGVPGQLTASNPVVLSSQSPAQVQQQPNTALFAFLLGLIVLFFLTVIVMILSSLYKTFKRRMPLNPKQEQQRYQSIEGWLISKRAIDHSDACLQIQEACIHTTIHNNTAQRSIPDVENCHSEDTDDTIECILDEGERPECAICMDEFSSGDIVSWAPTDECCHVFHHECIKQWLLKHSVCPICRGGFFPFDKEKLGKKALMELSKTRLSRAATTYFCLQEGLVVLGEVPASKSDVYRLYNSCVNNHDVKKKDLEHCRGNRAENAVSPTEIIEATQVESV